MPLTMTDKIAARARADALHLGLRQGLRGVVIDHHLPRRIHAHGDSVARVQRVMAVLILPVDAKRRRHETKHRRAAWPVPAGPAFSHGNVAPRRHRRIERREQEGSHASGTLERAKATTSSSEPSACSPVKSICFDSRSPSPYPLAKRPLRSSNSRTDAVAGLF